MQKNFYLPDPERLLKKSQSLALLDAIYCQQWEFRYFSHNAHWGNNEQMSSMRDGEGNDYFIHFSPAGIAIKGCFIETGLSGHSEILKNARALMPKKFNEFMQEAAFSIDKASFFIWFNPITQSWLKIGAAESGLLEDDGSQYLMSWLNADERFYQSWASEYYEVDIDLNLVKTIFDFKTIDTDFIKNLDKALDRQQLLEDIKEIDYPHSLIEKD